MASNKSGERVVRLGQTFSLGELSCLCRLLEGAGSGMTAAEVRQAATDPLIIHILRRLQRSRETGRRRLREADTIPAPAMEAEAAQ